MEDAVRRTDGQLLKTFKSWELGHFFMFSLKKSLRDSKHQKLVNFLGSGMLQYFVQYLIKNKQQRGHEGRVPTEMLWVLPARYL